MLTVDELTLPAVRGVDGQLQGYSIPTTTRGQKTDKHHHRFIILYWARPTEFSSCCTDHLELSSGTPALDTD